MIKGVNKKVVEINNPRSIYFEKAVLYLKPNMSCMPEKLVCREAEEFIDDLVQKPPKTTALTKLIAGASIGLSAVSITLIVLAVKFL